MLIGENIYKSFSGKSVLAGVNIEVKASEVVCLIGPSGCGKTTLLKVLSLLELPEQGKVGINNNIFNFPAGKPFDLTGIYPGLTIVFQQFQLWKHLTVRDNVVLPVKEIFKERKQLFEELVETLNINQILDMYPYQISVGQKQRVAFARAILVKPQYLLLDEITSSLDIEHINKIMQIVKRLSQQGTGIILTTHLIGFAKSVSDRIYFIDKGRVLEQGNINLLSCPQTERLKQFLSLVDKSE